MMNYPHLKLWTMPQHYFGAVWPATYSAGVGQSRDSDALERANFMAMLQAIGSESKTVTVVRESHWAVGWVEWIAIHQDNDKALGIADTLIARLEDYPVISDDLFSEYEDEDCQQVWANCYGPHERAEYLRKHVSKIYPLYGLTAYQTLRMAVKGDWDAAANLLPCPSDLLV